MNLISTQIHLSTTSHAEAVISNGGKDAWLRLYLSGDKQDTLTLFPADNISPEKMAAFVAAFNDIMTSVAPAQIEEAA